MKMLWTISVIFIGCFVDICYTKGIDLGFCDDTEFICACGQSNSRVTLKIKRCNYAYRWKVRCKPCNDLKEEDVCPKYLACKQCHADGKDGCASCPDGKFGTWCENDCTCINRGVCEKDGKCTCSPEFEGRNCEKRKGCVPPGPIKPPLMAVPVHLTDHSIPTCLPKCPLLSAPANGRLTFSANELVEGVTAITICNPYHRLIGNDMITCLAGGKWSGELPVCEKLATCPDPGLVQFAERIIPPDSVKLAGQFIQDSRIEYKCHAGYEQFGTDVILCLYDGTWSDNLPSCVKVSTVIPDCNTKGSDIVTEEGVSVRIICPPECVDERFHVWGTSIYRQVSSVCQAAVHSAKITNSGGQVAVINNGPYSHFTGSFSNNVESER
ncbi:limulus clotting factor C [Trichonephila inaurata madagascariensis]|uniref:Limulus clotting factor C n=1 Tax=Trichonephila inaurata madagascariensis TaxID=2747483 RepID=A0A8X6YT59_9ARAC|nr:limulus clotting factor C [Trichonephila inaurata madagascariensis]